MNYDDAIRILELKTNKNDINSLKKQYHKLALKFHPDKNKDKKTTQYFQEINEAYIYLINFYEKEQNSETGETNGTNGIVYNYIDIVKNFIVMMLDNINLKCSQEITEIIINGCKNISVKIFDNLDKNTIFSMYNFLYTHKKILYLDDNILDNILEIINKKYIMYILNPTLNDLLNDNIYKLVINDITHCVPLWCREVYFDNDTVDKEIIVMSIPQIEENNIFIDENNELNITFEINLTAEIFEKEYIEITVYSKVFKIPLNELSLKKYQYYLIKNKGILKNDTDIFNYDTNNRGNVLIKIVFI